MLNLLKTCITCKEEKPETEFYSNGYTRVDGSKKSRNDCKSCCRKRRQQYFRDPDKRKGINKRRRKNYISDNGCRRGLNKMYALRSLYGLTVTDFERMLQNQNSSCAICGVSDHDTHKGLFIDHDHKTQEVRGLLCINCNNGLGHFRDSEELLFAAANYLSQSKSKKVG